MNDGKICVSVCAATADELIEQIKRAEEPADVIEIRFDCLNEAELAPALQNPSMLNSNVPLLATYRTAAQGGLQNPTLGARIKFFEKFLHGRRGRESYVDFEPDLVAKLPFALSNKIVSTHDFEGVPENLEVLYEILKTDDRAIVKIAVQTDDIADTIPLWKLLAKAKSDNRKIIPIAMGEAGKWTRILGLAHGAAMTYAALDTGRETAPGQVTAADLREVYRVRELDEKTEVYGILGSNTSVSMSPYIHNAAFRHHGLNAVFVPLQVRDLDAFMTRMVKPATREIELGFKGFSVTIPHKQSIVEHLDFVDETARAIGAVNTVKIVDGKLHGSNTDAHGFIEPLLNSYGDPRGAKVAILGAGGAARACVYALRKHGADVTVFARDTEKARPFAEEFEVALKRLADDREQPPNYGDFDILVNTTPLGMKGKADGASPATAAQLKGLDLVYDLVYVPFQTPLMTEADRAEVPKLGGFAMLIAQAMQQQKIWTGRDAPLKEMSRAALARLA